MPPAAVASIRKLIRSGKAFCGIGFNSSKCKTEAKLAMARIKLLRNKREVVVRQMRRDVAMLLESRQDSTARIRIEHVIREQNIMAANEIIELFCELIIARLPIIAKQKDCPPDLKEGISSLIFAAPRCSDIPELCNLRDIFEKKYGRDFVSAATDLRPDSGVNRTLIERLSVRTPSGEVKLKFMKEIAKEYQVDWDATESETELLKPPEEPLRGPTSFISASTMPIKSHLQSDPNQNAADLREVKRSPQYKSADEAAKAAKELAEQATAAAEAAARLARRRSQQTDYVTHLDNILSEEEEREKGSSERRRSYNDPEEDREKERTERRHSYNARFDDSVEEEENREKAKKEREKNRERRRSYNDQEEEREKERTERRHSYNARFDDSVEEEENREKAKKEREKNRERRRSYNDQEEEREKERTERRHGYNARFDDSVEEEENREKEKKEREKNRERRRSHNKDEEEEEREKDKTVRRHSWNVKFDDSDGLESGEEEEEEYKSGGLTRRYSEGGSGGLTAPPNRPASTVADARVHPRLPDYEELTARFDALRRSRS